MPRRSLLWMLISMLRPDRCCACEWLVSMSFLLWRRTKRGTDKEEERKKEKWRRKGKKKEKERKERETGGMWLAFKAHNLLLFTNIPLKIRFWVMKTSETYFHFPWLDSVFWVMKIEYWVMKTLNPNKPLMLHLSFFNKD